MTEENGSTGMNFLKSLSGVETFEAHHTGTRYAVLAKAKGLAFAISAKVDPAPFFVAVYVRVRVEKREDWANLSEGVALFNFPEMQEKSSRHLSTETLSYVARQPTTPFEVGKIIAERKVVEAMIGAIYKRFKEGGVETVVTEQNAIDYVKQVFEDSLPSEPLKPLSDEDIAKIAIGKQAIGSLADELVKKYFKKKPVTEEKSE